MERLKIITYKKKTIVYADFSNFSIHTKTELRETIRRIKGYIAQQPPNSVIIISNLTGLHFDMEIIKLFTEFTAQNKPYIKASAIFGITGLLNIALHSVLKNALRDIHSFDSETQALDWLVDNS
jgi:hypothetical protein